MSTAPNASTVSLRPASILIRLDGEQPVDAIVTYMVGITADGQTNTLGGPGKIRVLFDPQEDAEMAEIVGQFAALIVTRLHERAGLAVPAVPSAEAAEAAEEL